VREVGEVVAVRAVVGAEGSLEVVVLDSTDIFGRGRVGERPRNPEPERL
jgi:hypothetical protein